jgi:hypothetical protein
MISMRRLYFSNAKPRPEFAFDLLVVKPPFPLHKIVVTAVGKEANRDFSQHFTSGLIGKSRSSQQRGEMHKSGRRVWRFVQAGMIKMSLPYAAAALKAAPANRFCRQTWTPTMAYCLRRIQPARPVFITDETCLAAQ